LGKGNIHEIENVENDDEIGEMVHSVNTLSKNLSLTANFAHEVGVRNFEIPFKPLSDEDTLGKALVAMRDDLKASEKELLKVNRELSLLFNTIDEVFFSIDMVSLKVTQVSKACEKLYGYPVSAFLNDHLFWLKLIHRDDRHILEGQDKMFMAGRQVNNQYRIVRSDNTIRWVENKITSTLNEAGTLVRLDGVTRDITNRKLAEDEFRKSEDRYRQIVETAQEGIWMIDEENKTVFVNKKMCEILGYSQEEMVGRTNLSFKDEAGRVKALQHIQERKQGINDSHESTFLTKDGKLVYVHVNTNAIFDEKGRYCGALAMMTDITQRKFDEESVKKSEANLRTIFNNTDFAYVLIDADFNIVSFNGLADAFSIELTNNKLQEGTPILTYFPGERHSFIKDVMRKVGRGETIDYEMSNNLFNGSKKWYEVKWVSVANKEKKRWGFILTSKDITEKKIARLEREKVTADLLQRNKDLQQFTYIVSHNLRAPVANIIGLSDLLSLVAPAGDLTGNKNLVKGLSASVKQLDNIIIDLNEILKVRNPGSETKENVCFSSLIEDIQSSINYIVDKENAVIKYDFSEADHAFTLKTYMYSIFYNLIVNSIKYKQPSISPLIEIKGYKCDKKVHLLFKDNGKGIDMQKNGSDIFMLYKRFDTTVEGKGIGLYMVKTAVETLGGTITLNSQVNQGTEFSIELPLLN
jgi:PAS domain S-box-containing protein